MKAMILNDTNTAIIERGMETPSPGPDEVLVRVHAAGVTPSELIWYPTTHTKEGGPRQFAVLGHEFSGVVAGVGEEISGLRIGDEVFGMNDWFAEGATAEYCLSTPASLARKPARLSHAEAATVPIGALTAWQGLFDRARLTDGERVLIHGGAGAVGVFAIQLARRANARVVTTASARHRDFLLQLGAEQVIDYRAERFEEAGAFDVVFDGVGGETLERSWSVLEPAGRLVTIAADAEGSQDARIHAAFFIVEPNRTQLEQVAHLLDYGELRTFVDAEVPFAEASQAYFGRVPRRNGWGKVVVRTASL